MKLLHVTVGLAFFKTYDQPHTQGIPTSFLALLTKHLCYK